MKLIRYLVIIFLVLSGSLGASELFDWGNDDFLVQRMEMRRQVLQQVEEDIGDPGDGTGDKRSIAKAVAFSLLVPGSGQFYSKSYIKAALFVMAEAAAWYVNISYNKKGDDKDAEFKDFANQHWSEKAYWSYVAYRAADEISNPPFYIDDLIEYQTEAGGLWYLIPDDQYTPETIARLREIEGQLPGFSHRLPKTKTQQYYEMIGKYPAQFGNAWDDASFNVRYTGYPPARLTSRNDYYMDMRDEANRFYNIAGYGSMVALINHVISAIDAGFTTRRYNKKHAVALEMSYKNIVYKAEYVNMFGLNVHW
ncbi:MAG: hypothetical protein Kow0042_18560 [Calditrichia bacterium]